MTSGLADTLAVLAEYPDLEVVVPVLASALEEDPCREAVLEFLLDCPQTRAPREVLRRWHFLTRQEQTRALERDSHRLAQAAQQLLRSDRVQTRSNCASLAAQTIERHPDALQQTLPLLLQLVDDPQENVRDQARTAFLGALRDNIENSGYGAGPRDPVLNGLSILLRGFVRHGDTDVIASLFDIGEHGADLLGRALGEDWDAADAIGRAARRTKLSAFSLAQRVDALFRWLRSPFPTTRDEARAILRERTDVPFLEACARRLEREHQGKRGLEHPTYRHLRWDRLPSEVLAGFTDSTLLRIAGFLQHHGEVPPEERANRIARLLPATEGSTHLELLGILRELPTHSIVSEIATVLEDSKEDVQLLGTELISLQAGRAGYALMIQQLQSPFESVRALAQRRISGHSLELYLDSFQELTPAARSQSLAVLRRVDLHFYGQIRRALRSHEEDTVVRTLQTVLALDDIEAVEDGLYDLTVSPSSKVRASLARALGRAQGDPDRHYLRLFLDDPDPRVIANTVEALGETQDPRVLPWLQRLVDHPHHRTRCNALLVLSRNGDANAREQLTKLSGASTPQPALRNSAAWALQQLAEQQ